MNLGTQGVFCFTDTLMPAQLTGAGAAHRTTRLCGPVVSGSAVL
jgi:hypothetical protein